jgi:hypothetical protein
MLGLLIVVDDDPNSRWFDLARAAANPCGLPLRRSD